MPHGDSQRRERHTDYFGNRESIIGISQHEDVLPDEADGHHTRPQEISCNDYNKKQRQMEV
jgi:hypothetical protein